MITNKQLTRLGFKPTTNKKEWVYRCWSGHKCLIFRKGWIFFCDGCNHAQIMSESHFSVLWKQPKANVSRIPLKDIQDVIEKLRMWFYKDGMKLEFTQQLSLQ